jgi:hypothetical protein
MGAVRSVALSGAIATATAGAMESQVVIALTGVAGIGSVASEAISITVPIAGASATTSTGLVAVSVVVEMVGAAANGSIGNFANIAASSQVLSGRAYWGDVNPSLLVGKTQQPGTMRFKRAA